MNRTDINPWPWSQQFGFSQGALVQGQQRVLLCSGQTSVNENGEPQHAGDMAGQIGLALDNLEAVLKGAGMTLSNLVRLNFYTTDVDAFLEHSDAAMGERLREAGVTPPGTLLGVARLAFPPLMIELEATAMD